MVVTEGLKRTYRRVSDFVNRFDVPTHGIVIGATCSLASYTASLFAPEGFREMLYVGRDLGALLTIMCTNDYMATRMRGLSESSRNKMMVAGRFITTGIGALIAYYNYLNGMPRQLVESELYGSTIFAIGGMNVARKSNFKYNFMPKIDLLKENLHLGIIDNLKSMR